MKKIMLAAVAASFVSTGASAVQLPAEGEVCSSIHSNISVGINNPELSDYRKCVMIQHDIDTAFTYKTFWVRNGDTFTSFPVETLAKMNRGERVELIKDGVTKAVLEAALAEQRETLEEAHAEAIRVLSEEFTKANARAVADLQDEINRLKDVIGSLHTAEDLTIEFNKGHAAGVESVDITSDNKAAEFKGLTNATFTLAETILENTDSFRAYGVYGPDGYINSKTYVLDSAATLSERTAEIRDLATHLAANILDEGNTVIDNIINQLVNAKVEQRVMAEVFAARDQILSSARAAAVEPTPTFSRGSDSIGSYVHVHINGTARNGVDITPETGSKSVDASGQAMSDNTSQIFVITVDGNEVALIVNEGYSKSGLEVAIEGYEAGFADGYADGFAEGYSEGYSDGYEDGYTQGYSDGFQDGVDSVN